MHGLGQAALDLGVLVGAQDVEPLDVVRRPEAPRHVRGESLMGITGGRVAARLGRIGLVLVGAWVWRIGHRADLEAAGADDVGRWSHHGS